MPTIKPSCINALKTRVNIADVIGRVVTLKKAGSRFKGLCPFHNEKTPSFHVDATKGFYKCFGCGKAGDAITFVRETEQLNFTEAVEQLCNRFNIPIEYEEGRGPTKEERSLRQELFAIHDLAAEHFHAAFHGQGAVGDFMREYWVARRKFGMPLADEFKIGAADANGGGLFARLYKEQFSEEALRKCGLFFINDNMPLNLNTAKSRFRGRLMIPIRDHQGRVVAFTARQTDLTPENDPAREAKYVNSPETPIFTKGDLLFNLDRARNHVKGGEAFLLVEGQLDAMRCWSVGVGTAVAPQGTAITEGQLHLLRRYSDKVECLFDSDGAGQAAAMRFLPMALKVGLEARFLSLAGNAKVDPDELFLQKGKAAYDELQANAKGAMQFACGSLSPDPTGMSPEEKTRVADELYAIVLNVESEVARSQFLDEVSRFLKIPRAALQGDFARREARQRRQSAYSQQALQPPPDLSKPADPKDSPEHHLLFLCLHFEDIGKRLALTFSYGVAEHAWIDKSHTAGVLLGRFLNEFEFGHWPGADNLDELLENEAERQLVASIRFEESWEDPEKIAGMALQRIKQRVFERRKKQIELALANLGADSDPIQTKELTTELIDINRQLRAPCQLRAAD